jgi:hypothetical protein
MSSSSLIRLAGLPALLLALIHRSAWKRSSANFACWAFCELRVRGFSEVSAELGAVASCAHVERVRARPSLYLRRVTERR